MTKSFSQKKSTINALNKEVKSPIRRKKFISYEQCKAYARRKKIKTMRHWFQFIKEQTEKGCRRKNVPGDPSKRYAMEWEGWGRFLGTNNIPTKSLTKKFGSLEETKQWFIETKIYTVRQFRSLANNNKKPDSVPSCPDKFYNIPYSEFLVEKPKKILPFKDAREVVRKCNIKDYLAFRIYKKEHPKEFEFIPGSPDRVYSREITIIENGKIIIEKGQWNGWPDFLKNPRV